MQCVYCEENVVPTEEELLRLADAHYKKIDLSDDIYVANIDGYIGESVVYGRFLGHMIYFLFFSTPH